MPRYSTLLFDLDGTLINSREALVLSVQAGFKAIGFAPPDSALIVRNIGKPLIDYPRLFGYQVTAHQQAEFTRYYRAYYSVHCGDHTEPYPGVRETLEFLHGDIGRHLGENHAEPEPTGLGGMRRRYMPRGWASGWCAWRKRSWGGFV